MDEARIEDTIAANSEQLNADDLIAGPIVVQVMSVREGPDDKQPIAVHISGGHKPWRPCKTDRRKLAAIKAVTGAPHTGSWIRLERDPNVMFGGAKVGGIRLVAHSGISKPMPFASQISRGKRESITIQTLDPPVVCGTVAMTDDDARRLDEIQQLIEEASTVQELDRLGAGWANLQWSSVVRERAKAMFLARKRALLNEGSQSHV